MYDSAQPTSGLSVRFYKHSQSDGGFVALVPLLVISMFAFTVILTLHQRQMAQGRLLKRVLDARLSQELDREMQRLQSLPAQQRIGEAGEDLAVRALDILLERSLDLMLDLEGRRARLRQVARLGRTNRGRQAARQGLRGLNKEINLARFWILMLETRQKKYRQAGLLPSNRGGALRPDLAGKPPKPSDSGGRAPSLPEWW